jgi:hypothetical protein
VGRHSTPPPERPTKTERPVAIIATGAVGLAAAVAALVLLAVDPTGTAAPRRPACAAACVPASPLGWAIGAAPHTQTIGVDLDREP